MKTLYPNIENVTSEFKYVLDVVRENFYLAFFTAFKKIPRNVVSGIRYIRFALNPVWVVSFYPVCVKSGLRQKNPKGDPFVTWKILQET